MNETQNITPDDTVTEQTESEQTEPIEQTEQEEHVEPAEPEKPKLVRGTAEGVVDPRAAAPKEDLHTEDKLELASMTRKERRAVKRQRYKETTEGMSRKEKFRYFLYAYKAEIFIPLISVTCVGLIISAIISNAKPSALSYAIVNCEDLETLDTSVISEDYMEYYDFGSGYAINQVLDISLSSEDSAATRTSDAESANYLGFPSMCQQDYYDVVITDSDGLTYMRDATLLHTMNDACSEELIAALNENCSDRILSYTDADGSVYAYAIDISGTDFADRLNVGYEPVYLCFPGSSEDNQLNISRLCNFIFDLGM